MAIWYLSGNLAYFIPFLVYFVKANLATPTGASRRNSAAEFI
jgi:hypothetical protein